MASTSVPVLTFTALAYEFLVRAEQTEQTVAYHAKRLMEFFSHFNAGWELQYDRLNPSAGGNVFRSTMMVAALSFALKGDLRKDFRDLGFPVSDEISRRGLYLPSGLAITKKQIEMVSYAIHEITRRRHRR